MTERLLQFIWQFQYFNKSNLTTSEDEPLHIIHPGTFNTNQGPDFLDAKLKIGKTIWAGSIELHINSSGWKNHNHSNDKNYNNVILHVVWQQDTNLKLPFPVLILADKVSKLLLKKFDALMNENSFIPCEKLINQVNTIIWVAWKQRLLVERLQQKSKIVLEYLKLNNNHWEETFWWMLAKNFGAKVNSNAFEKIAQSISITTIAKNKNQIHQIEALLLGQAGLLEGNFKEDYPNLLKKEYKFLAAKYNLKKPDAPLYFLRMRPANFPTVRLAQLAMLVHTSLHLFSKIKEARTVNEIKTLLNVTANDYWHYHYVFDEASAFKKKNLGMQMIENILINTICVVLFAYGFYNNENSSKDKAVQWLEAISTEKNSITKGFTQLGITSKTAFDSQALIQLKNNYCNKKLCLDCAIGNKLLKEEKQ
jgi:hypothetical protein